MDSSQARMVTSQFIPYLISRSNTDEVLIEASLHPKLLLLVNESGKSTLKTIVFGIPRHPAMAYEALSTLLICVVLFVVWKKNPGIPEGRLFGIFVTVLFSLRFLYEFLKENQVEFEDGLPLNMGQFLSLPMILAGVFILFLPLFGQSKKNNQELDGNPSGLS
jgi:prolipoprotein diacylglyceryltransferase